MAFKKPFKTRWIGWALALMAAAAAVLAWLALEPLPARSPQSFILPEYAEDWRMPSSEAEGAAAPQPIEEESDASELKVSAPYTDLSSEGERRVMNPADNFIERAKALRQEKARMEEARLLRRQQAKREIARRIIQRNREEGFEVILDENFNVISSEKIDPKTRLEGAKGQAMDTPPP